MNGQVLSSAALQASRSISSLEPAASTFGCRWSTAIAGSFCLLRENGVSGLPLLTSVSCATAAGAVSGEGEQPGRRGAGEGTAAHLHLPKVE